MPKLKRSEEEEQPKTERKVKKQKTSPKTERRSTTNDLLKAFGPQAVGLLVGGLLGGRDGAIAGGQQGAAAGQQLNAVLDSAQKRADDRADTEFSQTLQLDAANRQQIQLDDSLATNAQKRELAPKELANEVNKTANTTRSNQIKSSRLAFDKNKDSRGVISEDFVVRDGAKEVRLIEKGNQLINPVTGQVVPFNQATSLKSENQKSLTEQRNVANRGREFGIKTSADKQTTDLATQSLSRFESNKTVQDARSTLASLPAFRGQIAEGVAGNETSLGLIEDFALRTLAGGKGTATDEDIARVKGLRSLVRKVKATTDEKLKGQLNKEIAQEMVALADIAEKVAKANIDKRVNAESKRLKALNPRVFNDTNTRNFLTGDGDANFQLGNRKSGLELTNDIGAVDNFDDIFGED